MSTSKHTPPKREKYAKKDSHIWVEKASSPTALCPENFNSSRVSETNSFGVTRVDASHEFYDQKPKDFLASPSSLKSVTHINNPNLSSESHKSSDPSRKPTDSPSSQTKKKNRRTKRTSVHIPSNNAYSASSQTPESFVKFPVSSDPPSSPTKDSPKQPLLSTKPTISLASNPTSLGKKGNYIWVEKGASPTYSCPENFKSLIEKEIVPEVLKKPLSMSTYKEYFQALLYAEDCYLQKWDGFEMKNVFLQLHDASILRKKGKRKVLNGVKNVDKTFVAFEIDRIRERRPFLLSRDFVTLRPLKKKNKSFQGIIYRVVRSNLVLAEFGEEFHSQHDPFGAYDVKFSFNRVCLKRAHQAISDASDNLFSNFLFPDFIPGNNVNPTGPYVDYKVGENEACALREIVTLQSPPPYLVEGPLSLTRKSQLSKTGIFVVKTILQICRASSSNRILLCSPTNKICDMFVIGLQRGIPESDMFRANAAFRELDGVPLEILPSCLYETAQECFSCPSLEELCEFKVILSTYMSSFRLHNQGIADGHFSHIFLVNASSITEPETLVPLANFSNEKTTVIVSGRSGNRSGWIRSTIARENGLSISYFERVRNNMPDENPEPPIITISESSQQKSRYHTRGSSFC